MVKIFNLFFFFFAFFSCSLIEIVSGNDRIAEAMWNDIDQRINVKCGGGPCGPSPPYPAQSERQTSNVRPRGWVYVPGEHYLPPNPPPPPPPAPSPSIPGVQNADLDWSGPCNCICGNDRNNHRSATDTLAQTANKIYMEEAMTKVFSKTCGNNGGTSGTSYNSREGEWQWQGQCECFCQSTGARPAPSPPSPTYYFYRPNSNNSPSPAVPPRPFQMPSSVTERPDPPLLDRPNAYWFYNPLSAPSPSSNQGSGFWWQLGLGLGIGSGSRTSNRLSE